MTHRFGNSREFPTGFLWGAATSAYQIEGSPLADGAGASDWHHFVHETGRIAGGDTGDVACDHYRRWSTDLDLMQRLGLKAYRFSIAWGRVLPNGTGTLNRKGLDFYSALIDGLLARGITPFPTLHHWDLPLALAEQGGWLHADSPKWFADYAWQLYRALGDRVKYWTTFNEPWVILHCGYFEGIHPPGHRRSDELAQVARNLLLAHGRAVEAYRDEGRHQIGLVVNIEPKYPFSNRPDDIAATRRAHAYMNRQFLDPVLLGRYPKTLQRVYGMAEPALSPAELAVVSARLDFIGINYYSRAVVKNDPAVELLRASSVPQSERPHTAMNWEVFPLGLTDTLLWAHQRYANMPIYITENGAAFPDPALAHGVIEDRLRVDYLQRHLLAVRTAIEKGVDVRGYFAWSLLDNFEWSFGYAKRFGIVHVDHSTQDRTPKASAHYYSRIIHSHGASLEDGGLY